LLSVDVDFFLSEAVFKLLDLVESLEVGVLEKLVKGI